MTATDPRATEGVEAQYRQALDQGRFQIQHCDACDRAVFYPRMLCPHCGAGQLSWRTPDGRGTVYSTTAVRRKMCIRDRIRSLERPAMYSAPRSSR